MPTNPISVNTAVAGIGLAFLVIVAGYSYNMGTAWFPQARLGRGGGGTVDAFGGY